MMAFLATLGLPELIATLLFVALNAYVLMGGADLGSGIWDLLARGPRRDQQRALIASAIGPIWEANHVWLVIVVVICFTAFAPAYAALTTALHIPLALMLVGIVLRGSAFVFRGYGGHHAPSQARWGRTFAAASVATPVLLGTVIGTISWGTVPVITVQTNSASLVPVFVTPWLAPFPILIGLLTLALVAQLAATYLTLATDDTPLSDDFRRRALWSTGVAAALAAVTGIWFHQHGAVGDAGLLGPPRSWLWLAVTGLFAAVAIRALWQRRYPLARFAGCAEVSLILWGWAAAQYPYLVPPTITIRSAAAPPATLTLLLWTLIGGAVLLIPSLGYLLRTFAAHRTTS
jgi:cytochrome d ubiquinol oxidase subunit II